MNNKIKFLFMHNGHNVTWFIIGWLVTAGIRDLMLGNFGYAAFSFGFAYLNFILNDK